MANTKLSETQLEALRELADGEWVKTRFLSGTAAARSAKNLHSLANLGLIDRKRPGGSHTRQSQYMWRINDAGRAAIPNEPEHDEAAQNGRRESDEPSGWEMPEYDETSKGGSNG